MVDDATQLLQFLEIL